MSLHTSTQGRGPSMSLYISECTQGRELSMSLYIPEVTLNSCVLSYSAVKAAVV